MKILRRHLLYTFLLSTLILTVACNRGTAIERPLPELVHAESVMFDYPDSALHILEDMPMPSARWDKENHALWCLLTSQAQVKLI